MTTQGNRVRGAWGDRLSRRGALGVTASVGAARLFAGCRGAGTSGRGTASTAQVSGKPRSGGQISGVKKSDPPTFDPAQKLTDSAEVFDFTNDSLLGFKFGPDVKYDEIIVGPKLAECWETPDAKAVTFHLRQGVRFANLPPVNGRSLTSEDVKWTYEYMTRMGSFKDKSLGASPAAVMFEGLDRVDTPDAATVVVHFSQPFVPFVTYAASQWTPIVAHEVFDQDGDFKKRTAGTGPYQLDAGATQKGSRWVFKKNPEYFLAGRPYIDQTNWLIFTEDATADAAFQTRQIDILDYSGLSLDTVQRIKKAHPEVVEYDYVDAQNNHIYMNVTKPPLDDQRIRKAIALSIDRDEFIRVVASGKGQWAMAGAWPGVFSEEEIKQILKYDPAQAKQLLAAAGYPNGVDIELIYPGTNYGQEHITRLQLLQAQLKRTGININLKDVDHSTESQRKRTGDFQLDVAPRAGLNAGDIDGLLYATSIQNRQATTGE